MTYRIAYEGLEILREYLGSLTSQGYKFAYVDDRMQYDSIVNVMTRNDVKADEIEACLSDAGVELHKDLNAVAFVYVGTDYLSLLALRASKWDSRWIAGLFYEYDCEEGESVCMCKAIDIAWIVSEFEDNAKLFLVMLTQLVSTTVDSNMDHLFKKYWRMRDKLVNWLDLSRNGE